MKLREQTLSSIIKNQTIFLTIVDKCSSKDVISLVMCCKFMYNLEYKSRVKEVKVSKSKLSLKYPNLKHVVISSNEKSKKLVKTLSRLEKLEKVEIHTNKINKKVLNSLITKKLLYINYNNLIEFIEKKEKLFLNLNYLNPKYFRCFINKFKPLHLYVICSSLTRELVDNICSCLSINLSVDFVDESILDFFVERCFNSLTENIYIQSNNDFDFDSYIPSNFRLKDKLTTWYDIESKTCISKEMKFHNHKLVIKTNHIVDILP